jgi:hypothetical protein
MVGHKGGGHMVEPGGETQTIQKYEGSQKWTFCKVSDP